MCYFMSKNYVTCIWKFVQKVAPVLFFIGRERDKNCHLLSHFTKSWRGPFNWSVKFFKTWLNIWHLAVNGNMDLILITSLSRSIVLCGTVHSDCWKCFIYEQLQQLPVIQYKNARLKITLTFSRRLLYVYLTIRFGSEPYQVLKIYQQH